MGAVLWATPAAANNTESQNNASQSTASAHASATGGTLSVQAGVTTWTPPPSSPSPEYASETATSKTDTDQPYGCTYAVLGPATQAVLTPGGSTPGIWVARVNCAGPGVINPETLVWVTGAQQAPAPASPAALAQQAESELPLPSPAIEMAPPAAAEQLVNVPTWLWIAPAAWQALTASASAGPVTVTATAAPTQVVWTVGDGQQVTCDGPGTPYDPSAPDATTDCSYTWTQPSAGQPGGAYQVTATVDYGVTWTATGAAGGGNLGQAPGPAGRVAVRVAQSEALNTAGT